MMKATATTKDGRKILILGLSHGNLDELRSDGLKGAIIVDGAEMALPIDVIVTCGATEAEMFEAFSSAFGEQTTIRVSEKLKS